MKLGKFYGCMIVGIMLIFVFTSCKSEVTAKSAFEEKDESYATTRVQAEELYFDGLDTHLTIEQIENDGNFDSKRLIGNGWFTSYEINSIEYFFNSDAEVWQYEDLRGKLKSITLKANNQLVKTPRDIEIGDSFEDVITKVPQEQDWRKGENKVFYGDDVAVFSLYHHSEQGTVSTDEVGNIEGITIIPKGALPSLTISFEENKVTSISLRY